MNWEAIGAIAELLSGVGVLATLIYLAMQIRQNTDSVKESNYRNQTDRSIEHSRFVSGTPGMMSIYHRGMSNYSDLAQEEKWQFGTYMFSMFLDFQEGYHLHVKGRSEASYWKSMENNIFFYLSKPGGRAWWNSQGAKMLNEEFVNFVNSQLVKETRVNDT
jgi:hypothetical protein